MVRAGFQLTIAYYAAFSAIIWITAPLFAQILRVETSDIRFVPLLLCAIIMREFGFCVQQTRYKTLRLFVLEAVYFLGSAGGFVYLKFIGELNTAQSALNANFAAALISSVVAVAFGAGGVKLLRKILFEDIRQLFNYGLLTLGIGFSTFLINGMDVLLIAVIYTPLEVALYNAAKVVYRIISAFPQAVSLIAMPYASKLAAEKRQPELTEAYEKVIGYITVVLIGVVTAGLLFADSMYALMLGVRYAGSAFILCVMLLGAPFDAWFTTAGNFLYGAGFAKPVAWVSALALAIWTAVSIPGVYMFGGTGVAGGLALSMLAAGTVMHFIAMKKFNTDTNRILRRLWNTASQISSRNP